MDQVQALSDTARPAVSSARARSARALAARAARYQLLRRLPMLPEPSRLRLHQRVGRRLTPTAEAIYAAIRKAVRCGYPGAQLTVGELGHLTGRCERAVRYALRDLEAVDLVVAAPQFDDVEWTCVTTRRSYRRRQLASVYVLGAQAKRPGRAKKTAGGSPLRTRPARSKDHGGKFCPPTAPPERDQEEMSAGPAGQTSSPEVARAPEPASPGKEAERAGRLTAPSSLAAPASSGRDDAGPPADGAPDETDRPCGLPVDVVEDPALRRQLERLYAAWKQTPRGRRDGGES